MEETVSLVFVVYYTTCVFHLISSSRKQKCKIKQPVIYPDKVCPNVLLAMDHIMD